MHVSICSASRYIKEAHIVEDDADEGVEGNAEEVDDGGSHLLGHMLRAHLHHARPEQPHAELENTERRQLDLPLPADACKGSKRNNDSWLGLTPFLHLQSN